MFVISPGLDPIRQVVESFDYLELAIVFGSMAAGSQGADSDLDIALLARRTITPEQKIQIIDALAAAIGRPIDLIDLREAGQPILNQIIKHGQRILGSDELMALLIYKNMVDQADFVPIQRRIVRERLAAWTSK